MLPKTPSHMYSQSTDTFKLFTLSHSLIHTQTSFLYLLYTTTVVSVTSSGEIPPLWQIFKHLWQYILGLFGLGKVLTNFGTICMLLCKFSLLAVNGQILKTQSVHLVTLTVVKSLNQSSFLFSHRRVSSSFEPHPHRRMLKV